jgi:lauroyl/myristoyl acyltransferase
MRTVLFDLYNFGQFALAEAVARLPSAALRRGAIDALAHAAYRLSHEKRRLIERNVAYAFTGGMEPSETRRIAIGRFREFWQEMVDWVPAKRATVSAAACRRNGRCTPTASHCTKPMARPISASCGARRAKALGCMTA